MSTHFIKNKQTNKQNRKHQKHFVLEIQSTWKTIYISFEKMVFSFIVLVVLFVWLLFCLFFVFTWCWLAMDNLSCWFRCKRGSAIYSIFCWCWPRFTVSFRWCISMVHLKIQNDLHYSIQLTELKISRSGLPYLSIKLCRCYT